VTLRRKYSVVCRATSGAVKVAAAMLVSVWMMVGPPVTAVALAPVPLTCCHLYA